MPDANVLVRAHRENRPRIFRPPSTLKQAFLFIDELVSRPKCTILRAGPGHGLPFRRLCEGTAARGTLIADAAHAALAIEHGGELITADTDFARFSPPPRWEHL